MTKYIRGLGAPLALTLALALSACTCRRARTTARSAPIRRSTAISARQPRHRGAARSSRTSRPRRADAAPRPTPTTTRPATTHQADSPRRANADAEADADAADHHDAPRGQHGDARTPGSQPRTPAASVGTIAAGTSLSASLQRARLHEHQHGRRPSRPRSPNAVTRLQRRDDSRRRDGQPRGDAAQAQRERE